MNILIINSTGHWMNGWATEPKSLEIIIKVLEKASLEVQSVEVSSLEQLEQILAKTSSDTLVWVNAYWINVGGEKLDWLNTYVENHELPIAGQNQKTLEELLRKDACQSALMKANIPIPSNLVIRKEEMANAAELISNENMDFPIVVKPANESRSSGVKIVENLVAAVSYVEFIFDKYPEGNVIIEEFLSGDDITCGYIELDGQALLLPSYQVVEGMDCKNEVYGEEHYLLPASAIQHICVKDESILNQLKTFIPRIVDVFNIRSVTRIDSRPNEHGLLRFFDTNGMPGLNFPASAIIKQCHNHFPNYSIDYVFECLINTIVLDKLITYNLEIPNSLKEHNLFELSSETAMKLQLKETDVYA